jgi:hypothetical protein
MKTMINRIQLSILVISLASTVTMAQIPRDSMRVDTMKTQKTAMKIDSTKNRYNQKQNSHAI